MTPNTLARVGLFLLGAYLIVSACAGASSLFAQQPVVLGSRSASVDFAEIAWNVILGVIIAVVFGVLPGSYLIAKSETWAAAWFPPSDPLVPTRSWSLILYSLGLRLLGIYFAVVGLAAIFGSALSGLTLSLSGEGTGALIAAHQLRFGLGTGIGELLGGAVLLLIGRRATLRAA